MKAPSLLTRMGLVTVYEVSVAAYSAVRRNKRATRQSCGGGEKSAEGRKSKCHCKQAGKSAAMLGKEGIKDREVRVCKKSAFSTLPRYRTTEQNRENI